MIRRLKKDVQGELPPKLRSKVPVECSPEELAEIKKLMNQSGIKSLDNLGTNPHAVLVFQRFEYTL